MPVDGSYSNLSSAVSWARAHDLEAQRIAEAAHRRIRQVVSVPGVYAFSERLIRSYAASYSQQSTTRDGKDEVIGTAYAHEFTCNHQEAGRMTQCKLSSISSLA